jgi:hypothetical protein
LIALKQDLNMTGRRSKKTANGPATEPDRSELLSNLVFFRQGRVDGGIRTGIDAFDTPLLESVENEAPYDESMPVLSWAIEVRCKGKGLPRTAEEARDWFSKHQGVIRSGLASLAEELRVGLDRDLYCYKWNEFASQPKDVQLTLACSAHRRTDGMSLARHVRAFADHYEAFLNRLSDVNCETW